jgi:hypothetical protein
MQTGVSPALLAALGTLLVTLGLAACGGGDARQDANEPEGDFPVDVTQAKFPTKQQLADTVDLRLEIANVGDQAIPNLAVTIDTGDVPADGSFNIRSEQEDLADPNRPVWILENGFPKVVEPGTDPGEFGDAPSAGAQTASTNTYAFGELAPDESISLVWRVTPVQAGTFTVRYELATGLDGKAKAVADGGPAAGEFAATISDKPPKTRVTDSGKVEAQE